MHVIGCESLVGLSIFQRAATHAHVGSSMLSPRESHAPFGALALGKALSVGDPGTAGGGFSEDAVAMLVGALGVCARVETIWDQASHVGMARTQTIGISDCVMATSTGAPVTSATTWTSATAT